ncbi:DUF3293 domain-containing protein [Dyella solisilvae]|uniref:DUF3293 domain-containing protein n=1 Tax=Dyella solisilvae TaxID=1920168 RepID=A0A370KAQ1_9GAMM|nr:DUF3293 domain-containing protein [Dyella solisilvae]RDI99671.1 DUF3293 domain-containing protein [Dyella solisilvae]
MDERLLAAYLATDYRVRLTGGGWASIRIGHPLPPALRLLVGSQFWSVITAWNPRSQHQPRRDNRRAQQALLTNLRALADVQAIRGAAGVGQDGQWREPSLFLLGPKQEALDRLAQRFGQHAYVHGRGDGVARLRLLPPH